MRPDPFPDPDGQEPDGCLPPAEPDAEAAQQGLFLCLPAGSLDTDRFTQCGPAADMPPDPLLATIIDTVTGQDGKGLAGCSDDQLIGVIAAIRLAGVPHRVVPAGRGLRVHCPHDRGGRRGGGVRR